MKDQSHTVTLNSTNINMAAFTVLLLASMFTHLESMTHSHFKQVVSSHKQTQHVQYVQMHKLQSVKTPV